MTQYDSLNVKLSNSQLHKLSQTLFQYLLNPAEAVKKIEKKKKKIHYRYCYKSSFCH